MIDNEYFENLNVKIRIGPLLFDILLDSGFTSSNDERPSEKHNHSSYEIHFIKTGKGVLCIENTVIDVYPDSFFIISPGIYHSFIQYEKDPINKFHIKFEYTDMKNIDSYFPVNEVNSIKETLSKVKFYYLSDQYNNISLINDIHKELEMKTIGYYSKIQCLFTLIVINVLRSISPGIGKDYAIPQKLKNDKRSVIIEAFFDNYNNNLLIDDLARLINLSKRQLNRVLNRLYNTSFKQKLLDMRIEVAKDLLRNTNLSIEIISEKVGYSL